MILEALRRLVLDDPAVAALTDRAYPSGVLPQNPTLPALTFLLVSENRPKASPQGPLQLCEARFQIDAWAARSVAAYELAEAVRKKIDGYRGPAGDEVIQSITSETGRDFYESEAKQHRVSRDYMVWFEEPID